MPRSLRIGSVIALAIVAGLSLYTWTHWSPAGLTTPAEEVQHLLLPHRLRTGAEHDAALRRNGGNPYIFDYREDGAGALLYYGAEHTQKPSHTQVADITRRWDALQPTAAFYEGRSGGYFFGALIEPFAGLPEPALVHKLARRDGVPLYSLEPAYADEVAELLDEFEPVQVALYFFLRVYASEAGGVPNEVLAGSLLAKRTDVQGLRGTLSSIEDLDARWKRDFPGEADWRTIQTEPGYLAKISERSREIRGAHMIRCLTARVQSGERVFAVVGSGHVIRQEWNLRTLLGGEPAWDHPADTLSHHERVTRQAS